jgi:hypothetical protein
MKKISENQENFLPNGKIYFCFSHTVLRGIPCTSKIVVFGDIINSANSGESRPKVQKQNNNFFYEQNNSNVLLVQYSNAV